MLWFPLLAGPRMQTLHVNGHDMAYLAVGQGPPLVCVHGALGDPCSCAENARHLLIEAGPWVLSVPA